MSEANSFCQDETGIINNCLVNMQSDNPAERIFGRLQRDVLLAYRREKAEMPENVHVVNAVANVIASLSVNLVISTARTGRERQMLSTLSRMVEAHVAELLATSLAAPPDAATAAN